MTTPAHDCDHGWVHSCGGPHVLAGPDDTRTAVPFPGPADPPCITSRCTQHCSCFFPDGVHAPECALGASHG